MKKVFKYILIALLLFVGLLVCCVLYLFFVRGSSIFGITYVSLNTRQISKYYNPESVESIEIESNAFELEISNTSNENIYCNLKANMFGFTHVNLKNLKIKSELSTDTNTLKFTILEPTGALVNNGSKITLALPNNFTNLENLTIINYKSKTTIKLCETNIEELNYTSQIGSLNIEKCGELNKLNLEINSSNVYLNKGLNLTNIETKLSITSGLFDAGDSTLGDITISKNKRGILRINKCSSLIQAQTGDCGGTIKINEISKINFSGSDTVFYIGKIVNSNSFDNVYIALTKSGSIQIDELNSPAQLETNFGNIVINNSTEAVSKASTKSGNISILNAEKKVRCNSESGNIVVKFKDSAQHFSAGEDYRSVVINNQSTGKISIEGVEHFDITSSNNSQINISAGKLYGVNTVSAKGGNVKITFDKSSEIKIGSSSNTGKIRVNVTSVPEYYGTINNFEPIYLNCSQTDSIFPNTLFIQTDSANAEIVSNNLN